jgi:hypothetical protein
VRQAIYVSLLSIIQPNIAAGSTAIQPLSSNVSVSANGKAVHYSVAAVVREPTSYDKPLLSFSYRLNSIRFHVRHRNKKSVGLIAGGDLSGYWNVYNAILQNLSEKVQSLKIYPKGCVRGWDMTVIANGYTDYCPSPQNFLRIISGEVGSFIQFGVEKRAVSGVGGTFGSFSGLNYLTCLDETEDGNDNDKSESYTFNDKALSLAGIGIAIGGFVFLYKLWWKISFNLPCNPHIAGYVTGVIGSMVVAIIGVMIVVWRFMLAHGEW